jgi:sporulation-control protein spo0M
MSDIHGKWQQPQGQPLPGLWFEFHPDGTYQAALEEMGVTSSGTYQAIDGTIDIDQTQHTLGLLGKFQGLYSIEADQMTMNLSDPGGPRPESLEGRNKRLYIKIA